MTAAVQAPVLVRGDPAAIDESARAWLATADRCTAWAQEVRGCRVTEFAGDEAAGFDAIVTGYASELDAAAKAWRSGGGALRRYAERLRTCQTRLDGLALRWADADPGGGPCCGAAASAGSQAIAVVAEHDEAVRRCRAELDAARAMLPAVRGAPASPLASGARPAGQGGIDVAGSGRAAVTRRHTWTRPDGPVTARSRSAPAGMDLPGLAGSMRIASGQAGMLAYALPRPAGWDDFFGELGELLSVAGLALAGIGIGGGGGGLAIAGGAGAAVAAPEAAVAAGAVVAGVGLAILVASAIEGQSPGEELDDLLHHEIEGTPQADPHALAEINRSKIPPEVLKQVDETIARAKLGKVRFPKHDGKVWENRGNKLPPKPRGYYHEWTAAGPHSPRGRHRIIIGGDRRNPDVIYYWDHSSKPPIIIGP